MIIARYHIEQRVNRILYEALSIDPGTIESDEVLGSDLGADSIDLFDICFRLEQEFHITVRSKKLAPEFNTCKTVEYLYQYVEDKLLEQLDLQETKQPSGLTLV